jgi:hypothetical protein
LRFRGDEDRAIADFDEAILLNPANAAYYDNLCLAHVRYRG